MKLLFDLLPVILFFIAYKISGGNSEAATQLAQQWLGTGIAPSQAPILIATAVAIVATIGQVLWLLLRGKKVDTMLWASLGVITFFGGATLIFHDSTFIKWKPTVLYWLFSAGLLVGRYVFSKNGIRTMMQAQVELPEPAWDKLNLVWAVFFLFMGCVNLYVAFNYSESAWVEFKLYGFTALMLVFIVAQAAWMSRLMPVEATQDAGTSTPNNEQEKP